MNEEKFTSFLARLFKQAPEVVAGIGDDAAIVDLHMPGGEYLLAAADQVVAGIHFTPDTAPALVAEKLLKRNLSDIAAMGGTPSFALITLSLNPVDEDWLRKFHEGMAKIADAYHVSIIGGDVASLPAPGIVASLTILGIVKKEKICLRTNAAAGDCLYCTGEIGNSFSSGWHLHFQPRLNEAAFLAGRFTSAMQDISDGLLKDSARIAEASGLAVDLDLTHLPLRKGAKPESAPSDGEDYELLFAVPQTKAAELERAWQFPDVKLTRIGQFRQGTPGNLTINGQPVSGPTGYDHMKGAAEK